MRDALRTELVAGTFAFALPGTRADGVVLPLLAAAYEEHDRPKTNMIGTPGEVEVNAHRLLVDGGVAGDEAVDADDAAGDQEDEAEGDADVESHLVYSEGERIS